MARITKARHDLVLRFLIAVGLDEETAEKDAEGLEHHAISRRRGAATIGPAAGGASRGSRHPLATA